MRHGHKLNSLLWSKANHTISGQPLHSKTLSAVIGEQGRENTRRRTDQGVPAGSIYQSFSASPSILKLNIGQRTLNPAQRLCLSLLNPFATRTLSRRPRRPTRMQVFNRGLMWRTLRLSQLIAERALHHVMLTKLTLVQTAAQTDTR
jgi:hypothetical protein